jgi:hypothetical protein
MTFWGEHTSFIMYYNSIGCMKVMNLLNKLNEKYLVHEMDK